VAALDEKLGRAIRAKTAELRDQRLRTGWIAAAGASYAADALFLALFAAAGTVPWALPAWYAIGAGLVSAAFHAAVASGWSQRFSDPGMVPWQSAIGLLMQVAVVAHAPQIAWPYLANLFTVFAFGMIWIPLGASIALWAAGAALTGLLLYALPDRLGMALGGGAELALSWLFFTLVLGRCVLLSVYAAGMRGRLAESRRKLAESMEQIQQLVSYDELTKALNRRALIARLDQERARAERTGQGFSVALLDLDRFKAVNDMHGHAVGDAVLRRFAQAVHDTMRETDVFGRYGGEEFMMILTGTDSEAAASAVDRVRAEVQAREWGDLAPGLAVTVSAGVACWRRGESVAQLLHRADTALYEAKHGGRNQVRAA
jgi:diguanylate cyclase (GGDEF)-like protein